MIRGLVWLLALAGMAAPAAVAEELTVFAAASLTDVMGEIAEAWSADTGHAVTLAFAGSAALARQIEAGAPADLLVSADADWVDYLVDRQLVVAASRVDVAGNRLVLVAPADTAAEVAIVPGFDLAGLLGDGWLAMGNTVAVPAGRYGRAALESLTVWPTVVDRVAQTENVRAALALVSRGEVPLAIVYATDAAIDPGVAVVGTFGEDTHPPIVYPAVLTADADSPLAAAFLAHLADAQTVFRRHGFTGPP